MFCHCNNALRQVPCECGKAMPDSACMILEIGGFTMFKIFSRTERIG